MKINYKKFSVAFLFLLCLSWGMFLRHDFHHVLLAIASLLLAYGAASFFFEGKISRIIFFMLIAVILCQTSVTVKRAFTDEEFRQQLEQDSVGVFVQDVLHGFWRIVQIGANKGDGRDSGTFIERANSRYLTMAILAPVMIFFMIFKKST